MNIPKRSAFIVYWVFRQDHPGMNIHLSDQRVHRSHQLVCLVGREPSPKKFGRPPHDTFSVPKKSRFPLIIFQIQLVWNPKFLSGVSFLINVISCPASKTSVGISVPFPSFSRRKMKRKLPERSPAPWVPRCATWGISKSTGWSSFPVRISLILLVLSRGWEWGNGMILRGDCGSFPKIPY